MARLTFFNYLSVICLMMLLSCRTSPPSSTDDREDWVSLFNGENLNDWTIKISGKDLNENAKNTFVIEEDMIRVSYDEYDQFDDLYGHMYYNRPFSHYRIQFEYRFTGDQTKGGATWNVRNSGIMLHSQSAESNDYDQDFPVSIELQLLGGLGDGERTTGNVCTPGTAVMMGDTINYNHCINSSSKTYHGDQWVTAEAIVKGGESMTFLIEGETVLQFQNPQVGGGFISRQYAGRDWEMFGVKNGSQNWINREGEILTGGYIALQAESHPIDFRNIRLLDLCGCMDSKAKNFKTYFVCSDPASCKY